MSPIHINAATRATALEYARLGWPVLPLCRPVLNDDGKPIVTRDGLPACTHSLRGERCGSDPKKSGAGKIPLGAYVPHGARDATTDASTINCWFDDADARGHALNLGIAMGHGRFALDVDLYKSESVLEELEAIVGAFPETVQFHSGAGGVHLVFEDPVPGGIGQAPPRRRDGSVLPHIDVRSAGGYLVAPGSLHANGKLYVAEASSDPLDGVLPAPAPEALVSWLRAPSSNGAPTRLVADEPGRVFHDGERKRSLVSLAGSMHTRGMSEAAVVAAVIAEDAERCIPPLGEKEAARIARTVTKKPRIGPNAPKLRVVGPDEQPTGAWSDGLRRKKGGKLESTFGNACLILRHAEKFAGRLGYDEMALTPTWDGAALTDEKLGELREQLERDHDLVTSADTMAAAAFTVGCEKRTHPLRTYLEGLVWDGAKRVDTLAARALHATDPLSSVLVRRWMIAAVARAFGPGCKCDAVLVLIGTQGGGKSSFFKALAGASWFGDSPIDITNKDAVLQLRASWIYELSEIDGLTSRRHADQVKAFATIGTDLIRPPYARAVARFPRSSVFCGTTNRDDFLTDPSGARRFWLVTVPDQPVENALVSTERDQLWAEVVAAYRAGERWHLDAPDELALRARAREHMSADAWTEIVQAWLPSFPKAPTAAEILCGALRFDPKEIRPGDLTRIGQIMHSAGYHTRKETRADGTRPRVYVRDSSGESPEPCPTDDGPEAVSNLVQPRPTSGEGWTAENRRKDAVSPTCPASDPVSEKTRCNQSDHSGFSIEGGQVGQVGLTREKAGESSVQPSVTRLDSGVRLDSAPAAPKPTPPWSKKGAA